MENARCITTCPPRFLDFATCLSHTYVTLKTLLIFMNCCNVSTVDSSASFLQSLHHKWCFWKASFLQQLMLHVCSSPRLVQQLYLNDFLPPWTDAKWLFKLPFCVCKTIATIITLGILLSLMDCCYVSIQVSISCITNIEF